MRPEATKPSVPQASSAAVTAMRAARERLAAWSNFLTATAPDLPMFASGYGDDTSSQGSVPPFTVTVDAAQVTSAQLAKLPLSWDGSPVIVTFARLVTKTFKGKPMEVIEFERQRLPDGRIVPFTPPKT